MKIKVIILVASVFALIFGLCGCQKPVDSSEITFEEMTLTLPYGEWYYGEDDNQYVSDNCSFTLVNTDDRDYRDYDKSFEFLSYEDHDFGGYPFCDFMYIDGYVAEFYSDESGLSMMIEYGTDYASKDYYVIFAEYIGDKKAGKEEMKEILRSVKFPESGHEPCIGVFWQDAISDVKPELTDGITCDLMVQGWVSEITHAPEEKGKPYYIDVGGVYPDPNRVTGVLWEEYQNDYDDSVLAKADDHFALLMGEAYLYNNILNIRLTDSSHVKPIYRVDDL